MLKCHPPGLASLRHTMPSWVLAGIILRWLCSLWSLMVWTLCFSVADSLVKRLGFQAGPAFASEFCSLLNWKMLAMLLNPLSFRFLIGKESCMGERSNEGSQPALRDSQGSPHGSHSCTLSTHPKAGAQQHPFFSCGMDMNLWQPEGRLR